MDLVRLLHIIWAILNKPQMLKNAVSIMGANAGIIRQRQKNWISL
jgi:hypothetical protein